MADDVIREGREAGRILGSDVFLKAVEAVRDDLSDAWMRAPGVDSEEAIQAWYEQKSLARVIAKLNRYMQDAEIEQAARDGDKRVTSLHDRVS